MAKSDARAHQLQAGRPAWTDDFAVFGGTEAVRFANSRYVYAIVWPPDKMLLDHIEDLRGLNPSTIPRPNKRYALVTWAFGTYMWGYQGEFDTEQEAKAVAEALFALDEA